MADVETKNEIDEVLLHEGDGLMDVEVLENCKNAVCLIRCQTNSGSPVTKRGTGFYAKASIFAREYCCIVTNHHVLTCESDAAQASAIFYYEGNKPGQKVRLRPDKIFRTNMELDYTVVGLDEEELNNIYPKVFPLDYNGQPEANKGDDIFIFQHPRGCPKKFSYEKVIRVEPPYVFYCADTDEGSSGSPVLRKLCLLALHQKGNKEDGYNKGTLFSAIIEDLHSGNAVPSGKRTHTETSNGDVEDMEESCMKRKCIRSAGNGDSRKTLNEEITSSNPKAMLPPDDETLDNLCSECTGFYKHLGRRLGINNVRVEEIGRDHINYRTDREKCFQLLQEWKESESSPFNYGQLGKALRSLHKNALANKYCGK